MPRGLRTAFENAVSESILFKLPLELRTMIYKELLIQEGGMSIPSDSFKRLKSPRQGSRPAYCDCCAAVFSNQDNLSQRHHCSTRDLISRSDNSDFPDLPTASTSILRVCRLTHVEASPILYTKNAFRFSTPAVAQDFLWKSDHTQAVSMQEIIVTLAFPSSSNLWWNYITQSKAGLAQDFPHLRRMIINLRGPFAIASTSTVRSTFQRIAENFRDLDWVHIDRLVNEGLLDHLKPMVFRSHGSQVLQRRVQSHVTGTSAVDIGWPCSQMVRCSTSESINYVGWKNATLWWGTSESRAPYRPIPSEPYPYRDRLFRLGSGDDDRYAIGSSFL